MLHSELPEHHRQLLDEWLKEHNITHLEEEQVFDQTTTGWVAEYWNIIMLSKSQYHNITHITISHGITSLTKKRSRYLIKQQQVLQYHNIIQTIDRAVVFTPWVNKNLSMIISELNSTRFGRNQHQKHWCGRGGQALLELLLLIGCHIKSCHWPHSPLVTFIGMTNGDQGFAWTFFLSFHNRGIFQSHS